MVTEPLNHNTGNDAGDGAPSSNEPVKVVLVDDDDDDREIFTEAVKETSVPADVTTLDTAADLIDHLRDPAEPNPDIIFLDVNMPLKGGKEVLREIKQDETLKEIPTVMLSTSAHPQELEETFNSGADRYVRKPYSFQKFVLLLKKIFFMHWAGRLLRPLRKHFFLSEKGLENNS
jgi:CheY-like chemotaxis protein